MTGFFRVSNEVWVSPGQECGNHTTKRLGFVATTCSLRSLFCSVARFLYCQELTANLDVGKNCAVFLYQQMNLNMDIATVFFLTTSNQVIKWLNYDQVDGWFYSLLVTNMTNEIQIIALSSLVGGLEHLKNQIHSLGNGKSSQLTNFVHHFSEG